MSSECRSSSLSNFLRENLKSANEIKAGLSDPTSSPSRPEQQSSQIEQLQVKAINLESQLKIAREACSLQEAEFSFQREQYESEISNLHKIEESLREKLTTLESEKAELSKKIDVKVKLDETQSPIYKKYQKWKQKAKASADEAKAKLSSVEAENQKLKDSIESLQAKSESSAKESSEAVSKIIEKKEKKVGHLREKNGALQARVKELELQIANERSQSAIKASVATPSSSKSEVNSLRSKIEDIKKEKDEIALQVLRSELKVKNLQEEASGYTEKIASLENTIKDSNNKNGKLTSQVAKQAAIIEQNDVQLSQLKSKLNFAETQYESVCDQIGAKIGAIDAPWSDVTAKLEDFNELNRTIKGLSSQNQKLRSRLDAAMDLARNGNSSELSDAKKRTEELQKANKDLTEYREKGSKVIQKLTQKYCILKPMEEELCSLNRQISDLHGCLTSDFKGSMFPAIICIVFAKRMLKKELRIGQCSSIISSPYQRKNCLPIQARIATIREMFTALTRELCVSKHNYVEHEKTLCGLDEENKKLKNEMSTLSNSDELMKAQQQLLTSRMKDLQQELASLISVEQFKDLTEKHSAANKQKDEAEALLQELKKEFAESEQARTELRQQIITLEEKQKQTEANLAESQGAGKDLKEKIEMLQSLVKEKTNDILALERIVQKQKEIIPLSASCQQQSNASVAPLCQSPAEKIAPSAINPCFLGK